jgi:hypothetical protein
MSKFIQRLNELSRIAPPPMGFRAAQGAAPKHKIQLVARVRAGELEAAKRALGSADAVIVEAGTEEMTPETLHNIETALGQSLWGWRGKAAVGELPGKGADFIVLAPGSALKTVALDKETGRIMEAAPDLSDSLLRALNRLPVDAVLVGGDGTGTLAWRSLIEAQRAADFLTRPVLAFIPPGTSEAELLAFWEAGVDGVVVALGAKTAARFLELRSVIDNSAFPAQRRRGKLEALLPYASGETQTIAGGDDDEEEEDE